MTFCSVLKMLLFYRLPDDIFYRKEHLNNPKKAVSSELNRCTTIDL